MVSAEICSGQQGSARVCSGLLRSAVVSRGLQGLEDAG